MYVLLGSFGGSICSGQSGESSSYVARHLNDQDLLRSISRKGYVSPDVRENILREYLQAEHEAVESSSHPKSPSPPIRTAGLAVIREYVDDLLDPSLTNIRSLRSRLYERLGRGGLVFPRRKKYGLVSLELSPQPVQVSFNGQQVPTDSGKVSVLPGKYVIVVTKQGFRGCTHNIVIGEGETRVVKCSLSAP
jgi:hypothetical protein